MSWIVMMESKDGNYIWSEWQKVQDWWEPSLEFAKIYSDKAKAEEQSAILGAHAKVIELSELQLQQIEFAKSSRRIFRRGVRRTVNTPVAKEVLR